jgi:aryl-alcohol dehydrogenase-like predicted oxidoreductase
VSPVAGPGDAVAAIRSGAMRYVEAQGVRMSAIGVGTWQFGSKEWGYGEEYASTTAVQIVQRALELGVTLIDTAEIYAMGTSERIVGQALRQADPDLAAQAFVATKVFPIAAFDKVVQWRGRLSRERLGVEAIDLYQVHWPNPAVPKSQTMGGMRALREAGVIRHVGVSNHDAKHWYFADRQLGSPVLSNQVRYSLVDRTPEQAVLPYARSNDRIVIAYSPLGQGLLSGRFDVDHRPTGGVRRMNALFLPENLEKAAPLLAALREIADWYDATPAQVALAWVIRRPNVVAIPGASSVAQLEANVAAADLTLTDDDDRRLTAASDAFDPVHGVAALPALLAQRAGG